jgi:predicted HTH domain antitoxin
MFTSLKQSHSERVSLRRMCFLLNVQMDQALQSVETRSEQYDECYNNFGFL